jgi:hypothetical protein
MKPYGRERNHYEGVGCGCPACQRTAPPQAPEVKRTQRKRARRDAKNEVKQEAEHGKP